MNYLLHVDEVLTLLGDTRVEVIWVKKGRIWLTREDDPRDYFLVAGNRLELGTARPVVVEALEDSELALVVAGQEFSGSARLTLALSSPAHR